jgi:hypothetical protein
MTYKIWQNSVKHSLVKSNYFFAIQNKHIQNHRYTSGEGEWGGEGSHQKTLKNLVIDMQ